MTQKLRICLLGDVSIQLGGEPVTGLPSRAAEALLIYLVCSPRPINREKLGELLWADRTQAQAMTNLRTILTPLRRVLGDYLAVTRRTLAFDHQKDYWLDINAFENQFRDIDLQKQGGLEETQAKQLESVLELYQGNFLADFFLRDGRGFEEWAVLQRERLRLLAQERFRLLAHYQLEVGDYAAGILTATRWMNLAPYDEDACRTLMWLLARDGQRNVAIQHFRDLEKLLTADLGISPTPATSALCKRLQNLDFPPFSNLPTPVTSFVGRSVEIAEIEQEICGAGTRLLTILGPGGIGKTRLAIEIGRSLAKNKPGRFIDGISFVSLAAVETPEAAATRIATSMSFPLQGSESPQIELIEHLRDREVLLILDNFEHLIDKTGQGLAFLVEIIHQAPKIKFLITSRERLNLYEEFVFDLPGLDLPEQDSREIEASSAVALFLQNAQKSQRKFSPSVDELTCIAQACRIVEGVPLAIELAASWILHYSCTEIVSKIETSLDFLSSPYRNMPERHRSLRAVFEHSWNLLSQEEQVVFAQLSIFRGGFSQQAAATVVCDPLTENILHSLVEKSLIQPQPAGRYDIHPLLHEYADEKLQGQNNLIQSVSENHAVFYIEFLEHQHDGESLEQRAAIRLEIQNINAAWSWAVEQLQLDLLEAAAPILHNFYSTESWFLEGIERFQFAIESLKGEDGDIVERANLLCDLLGRRARMLIHIGSLEAAREDLLSALAYLEFVEDPNRRSTVLSYLALTHFYAGEYQPAVELAEESRILSEKSDDKDGIAFAHNFMGSCYKALGDYDLSSEAFKNALEVYWSLEDEIGAAMVLHNLGNLAQAHGDYQTAQNHYQECGKIFKAHDHIHGAAATLTNAGKLALRQEEHEKASSMLKEGLEMKSKIGDQRGMAVALIALGDVSVTLDDVLQAREYLDQGLTLAIETGDVILLLDGLAVAAEWFLKKGDLEIGLRVLEYVVKQQAASKETRERAHALYQELEAEDRKWKSETSPWREDEATEEVAYSILSDFIKVIPQ